MSQIYQARRRRQDAPAAQKLETTAPGPSLRELAAGARPSVEQMGRQVDLPGEIREKMESSFGADFSGVRLYESQTVADAGAEAMTMGNNIAFAPGRLDLASTAGQALLGHELSHVVSQARGESAGQGFLADTGLEAQADRQGMLAAQGESAYSGPVSPVGASAAASASGPMQAKKPKTIAREALEKGDASKNNTGAARSAMERYARKNGMNPALIQHQMSSAGYGKYLGHKMSTMGGDEAQEDALMELFMNGDQYDIGNHFQQEMNRLTLNMGRYEDDLVSEDFKTRANAYTASRSDSQLAASLEEAMSRQKFIEEGMEPDSLEYFRGARKKLDTDRDWVRESLKAKTGQGSMYFPEERKNYRRRRRNEIYDRDMNIII